MASDYLQRTKTGTVFVGSDVDIFAACTLASGLRLYAKTKMQPNRNWTPTKMLKNATKYTGNKYKRGEYEKAADEVQAFANEAKQMPRWTGPEPKL